MKKQLFIYFFITLTLFLGSASENILSKSIETESTSLLSEGECVSGQVLITIPNKSHIDIEENIQIIDDWQFDSDYHVILLSSSLYTTEELLVKFKSKDEVIFAEPNYIFHKLNVSNDPYVEKQWHQEGSSSVGAAPLWSKATGNAPIVAVVDTGIDYTHEDLSGNMWVNPYKSKGLKGTYGYDFASDTNNPMDTDGHGTHVAGIIAARLNNNLGVAGVSANAKLMSLKIFSSNGNSRSSSILDAFQYIYDAKKYGANIVAVNCSWGGGSSSSALEAIMEKISSAGTLFVFAAGNSGVSSSTSDFPFNTSGHSKIVVGASNAKKNPCDFSNYSQTLVDLFAPGDTILSTVPQTSFLPTIYNENKRLKLTSFYDNANNDDNLHRYAGVLNNSNGDIITYATTDTISYLDQVDFFNKNSGCYKWTCTVYPGGIRNYFYYDVTDLALDTSKTYYVSLMLGEKYGTDIEWSHEQFISKNGTNRFFKKGERTYMKIIGLSSSKDIDTSTYYIDEIAISNANPNTNEFGKYDFYTGTSMAAPVVSGSIALLAMTYPDDTPSQRKARLLKSISKSPVFANKCITGGILSLSLAPTYKIPQAKSIVFNMKKKSLAVKKSLQMNASVLPIDASNTKITWSVNKPKYARISVNGKLTALTKGAGKSILVTATCSSNKSIKKSISILIKKQKVTSLFFKKKILTLKVGKKIKLKPIIKPSYANNKSLKWICSNKKYIRISKTGMVTALRSGIGKKVIITVKTKDSSRKKATCKIAIR